MDKTKVFQLLYAEFGEENFLTSQITEETMRQLAGEIGAKDVPRPDLDRLIRTKLESMYGVAFRLQDGGPAEFDVDWSKGVEKEPRFQIVPIDVSPAKQSSWESEKPVGVQYLGEEITYSVVITYAGNGFSASCPALRGCVSQGETEEEALKNIGDAIRGWLQSDTLNARRRVEAELEEELEAGFPAKVVNVKVGPIIA